MEMIERDRRQGELDREIGIYPETKHPTYFKSIGLALEPKLVDVLNRNGLNRRNAKVYVPGLDWARDISGAVSSPVVARARAMAVMPIASNMRCSSDSMISTGITGSSVTVAIWQS